ncbi:MAG: SIR2 family protein [Dehalococcoidia bacterium]
MNRIRIAGEEQEYTEDSRDRVFKSTESWLSTLIQSDRMSLLLGSGFTTALTNEAGGQPATMAAHGDFGPLQSNISKRATERALAVGRSEANIEDELSAAMELLPAIALLEQSQVNALRSGIAEALKGLVSRILEAERSIAEDFAKPDSPTRMLLQSFLLSFSARPSRSERLGIFTTNYDRVIEFGADMLGLRMIDRFVGSLSPIFRSSRIDIDMHYNPPGIRGEPRYLEGVIRLTKLHGSVDWFKDERNIFRTVMPFGYHDDAMNPAESVLVYPNAAKELESAAYPYSELFRDFASAICRPESALVTYGYGFGDEHVNRVIRDMLAIHSTHLVIISYDNANGRLDTFLRSLGDLTQVSVLMGPDVASLQTLVASCLPKPALDPILQREYALRLRRGHIEPTDSGSPASDGDA